MNSLKKSISPFIETIRIESGEIYNLPLHQQRLDLTQKAHWSNHELTSINLKSLIIPPDQTKLYRCRVLYDHSLISIEYLPYQRRSIQKLQLVYDNQINYAYKSSNRHYIDMLFEKRGNADDILMIKNNQITDSSIANVALLKNGVWYTPKNPLLCGTQRALLLQQKAVEERVILANNLQNYSHITLFNAMIPFKMILLPINVYTLKSAIS